MDAVEWDYRAALHEAGHAVIAHKLKIKLSHVEIARPGGVLPDTVDVGGLVQRQTAMASVVRKCRGRDAYVRAKPYPERLCAVRREIKLSFAGKWAESVILGGYYPFSFKGDEETIVAALAAFPSTEKTKTKMREKYESETRLLVIENIHVIEAVAKVLVKHRRLTGREVSLIAEMAEYLGY
jgi:hypothetical protein